MDIVNRIVRSLLGLVAGIWIGFVAGIMLGALYHYMLAKLLGVGKRPLFSLILLVLALVLGAVGGATVAWKFNCGQLLRNFGSISRPAECAILWSALVLVAVSLNVLPQIGLVADAYIARFALAWLMPIVVVSFFVKLGSMGRGSNSREPKQ